MLDTNKTKAFDIIASVYMFRKQFQIITINHRRHERPMPLCRQIYIYTIETARSRIWKLDFRHEPRQKIVLTDFATL